MIQQAYNNDILNCNLNDKASGFIDAVNNTLVKVTTGFRPSALVIIPYKDSGTVNMNVTFIYDSKVISENQFQGFRSDGRKLIDINTDITGDYPSELYIYDDGFAFKYQYLSGNCYYIALK